MIVYTIIQILLTLAGAGVIGYSIYLTIQVSGDKLLTLDSELGYRYATSYHRWQLYAGIAIVSLLILWIVYILIVRAYRVNTEKNVWRRKPRRKMRRRLPENKRSRKNYIRKSAVGKRRIYTACKCSEYAATICTRLLSGWLCGKCAKLLPEWLRNECAGL